MIPEKDHFVNFSSENDDRKRIKNYLFHQKQLPKKKSKTFLYP
jgi:hypothetical protein